MPKLLQRLLILKFLHFGEITSESGQKNLARATPSQRIGRIYSEDWPEKRITAIVQRGAKKKK